MEHAVDGLRRGEEFAQCISAEAGKPIRTARIEVGQVEIDRLMERSTRERIVAHFKSLGFIYVTLDMQGYRTGSMNEVLTAGEKAAAERK